MKLWFIILIGVVVYLYYRSKQQPGTTTGANSQTGSTGGSAALPPSAGNFVTNGVSTVVTTVSNAWKQVWDPVKKRWVLIPAGSYKLI